MVERRQELQYCLLALQEALAFLAGFLKPATNLVALGLCRVLCLLLVHCLPVKCGAALVDAVLSL